MKWRIGAFSIGLALIVAMSNFSARMKKWAPLLIGLGSFYPAAWFATFYLAPSLGRSAAHAHWITQTLVYVSVPGLVAGIAIVVANLYFGFAKSRDLVPIMTAAVIKLRALLFGDVRAATNTEITA